MTNSNREHGLILTRHWRDTPQGLEFSFWVQSTLGPVRLLLRQQQCICFVANDDPVVTEADERRPLSLKTLKGVPVDALYFGSHKKYRQQVNKLKQRGIPIYESDIRPVDRFLMERFISAAIEFEGSGLPQQGHTDFINPRLSRGEWLPKLSLLSIDIEGEGPGHALFSIAAIFRHVDSSEKGIVFLRGKNQALAENQGIEIHLFDDEKSLLLAFFTWVQQHDPDIIIGWNVIGFDLQVLQQRCDFHRIKFNLARGGEASKILMPQESQQTPIARIPGRVVLDGIDTLRNASWSFESFSLNYVAHELLGKGKLIEEEGLDKLAEIRRLFNEDPVQLARYNLEDCRLVLEIFDHTELIDFAIQRSQLTGLAMERNGGSVAAFDYLYLPQLHRHGFVANDIGDFDEALNSPGGYVMDSQPGFYDNVLVLDFKSLYPSIIRSFKVDPLGLAQAGDDPIEGFAGGSFSRTTHILPGMIETLWQARDEAKKSNNPAMSQVIKIIMNSFYGVMGTTGCRFYNPKLASSITRRGHEIITRSKAVIEQHGYQVIYGDTDSLFVLLGPEPSADQSRQIGQQLASELNRWWSQTLEKEHRLTSFLEIEFETHYLRFLLPTIRGSDKGSKKRYAGLIDKEGKQTLIFKGLESVRTDWTPMARSFQRELYQRIFHDLPYEDYIRETVQDLREGRLDDQLYYRKRLRRNLEEYVKNVPPHVQAARKLAKGTTQRGWIEYAITLSGPEPKQQRQSDFDYQHYIDKQLRPIADGVLHFFEKSFEEIEGQQISLF